MFYCLQENKKECREIFNICILIAPEDANCFVKNSTSNGVRKKETDVSNLSSYKNSRQIPTAAVKFLYTGDNGTDFIYYHLR